MVYYISNPTHREKVLVDVEFYWNEEYSSKNERYEWNLDVKTTIVAENVLEELFPKIKSGEFSEANLKKISSDIKELRDLRMWLWEKSDVNRTLNRTNPNSPESQAANEKANKHIRKTLESFAKKWGYELYFD